MIKIQKKCYEKDNYYNKDIYDAYREEIKSYINRYNCNDYGDIIKQDKKTNIMMIFSEMRSNIIKWYPFEKSKKILEIGANYGEITQELVKKCEKVTAIEFSMEKAGCIAKRLEDVTNLDLIVTSNLKNVELEEKYDYITLIGIGEYAEKLGFANLQEMLLWAYQNIAEDGKVLLAIDNKLGVKYLVGSTRNVSENPFANYKPYINKDYKLYGKTELESILKKCGKLNYKFYYPLPNYNLTQYIYTDKYLPKNSEYSFYYREDEEILFNESVLIQDAIKNEKFDFLTNSYLIEIAHDSGTTSNISYVNYSNMRKQEYKIITKLAMDKVVKESYENAGKNHIQQISRNIEKLKLLNIKVYEDLIDNKIESKYIDKMTMDIYLKSILQKDLTEQFVNELDKWYHFIKDKFQVITTEFDIFDKYDIKILKEKKQKLTILKDGFIDAIFQNVFYEGEEYILFDQEWYEESVPLEYIMYRSIRQLFFKYNELENKINKQYLYEKYNIAEYIEEFEELEKQWQKEIVNSDILDFYTEKWNRIISIEDIKFQYNQQIGKLYSEKDKLTEEIKELNEKIRALEEYKEIEENRKNEEIKKQANMTKFEKIIKILKQEKDV